MVLHELERVEEKDEDRLASQDDDKENDWGRRRAELGRLRTLEPMGMDIGIIEDNDEPCCQQGYVSKTTNRHERTYSTAYTSPCSIEHITRATHCCSNYLRSRIKSPSIRTLLKLTQMQPQPHPSKRHPRGKREGVLRSSVWACVCSLSACH